MNFRTLMLLSVFVLLAGCSQETSERVVEAYLLSDTAKGRARFVLDPKTALPRMEKHYREISLSGIEVKEVSRIDGEGDAKPGKYGKYRAGYININRRGYKNTVIYYVKNTKDGFKIDWEAAVGYNEMPWNTFMASRPTKPVAMRVEATLSDYYNYDFRAAQRTHYSIRFLGRHIFGYVRKDSRAGKRLFNILKDGDKHSLVLSLRYLPNPRYPSGEVTLIDKIVSEDWLIR